MTRALHVAVCGLLAASAWLLLVAAMRGIDRRPLREPDQSKLRDDLPLNLAEQAVIDAYEAEFARARRLQW